MQHGSCTDALCADNDASVQNRFNSILETLYLLSDPTLMDDIDEAERTHDEARDWRECLKDTS